MACIFRKDEPAYDLTFDGVKHLFRTTKQEVIGPVPIVISLNGQIFTKNSSFIIVGAPGFIVTEFTDKSFTIKSDVEKTCSKRTVIAHIYIFRPIEVKIMDSKIANIPMVSLPKNGKILFITKYNTDTSMDEYKRYLDENKKYKKGCRVDIAEHIWEEMPYHARRKFEKEFVEIAQQY